MSSRSTNNKVPKRRRQSNCRHDEAHVHEVRRNRGTSSGKSSKSIPMRNKKKRSRASLSNGRQSNPAAAPSYPPNLSWKVDLSSLCDAAARNDYRTIHSCLLSDDDDDNDTKDERKVMAQHDTLLPPSRVATALHQLLFQRDCDNAFYNQNHNITEVEFTNTNIIKEKHALAVRSLLMLPPYSVSPWNTIVNSIQFSQQNGLARPGLGFKYHDNEQNTIPRRLTYISDIAMFLNTVGIQHDDDSCDDNDADEKNIMKRRICRFPISAQRKRLLDLFNHITKPLFRLKKRSPKKNDKRTRRQNQRQNQRQNPQSKPLIELLPVIISAAIRLDQQKEEKEELLAKSPTRDSPSMKTMSSRVRTKSQELQSLYSLMMDRIFQIQSNDVPQTALVKSGEEFTMTDCDDNNTLEEIEPKMILHLLSLSNQLIRQLDYQEKASTYLGSLPHLVSKALCLQNGKEEKLEIPMTDFPAIVQEILTTINYLDNQVVVSSSSLSPGNHNSIDERQQSLDSNENGTNDVKEEQSRDLFRSWTQLLLNVYTTTSSYEAFTSDIVESVESVVLSAMSNLPRNTVTQIVETICTIGTFDDNSSPYIPPWVCATILSFVLHSKLNNNHFVQKMISDMIEKKDDTMDDIVNTILMLSIKEEPSLMPQDLEEIDIEITQDDLEIHLTDVVYAGHGQIGYLGEDDSLGEGECTEQDLCFNLFSCYFHLIHGSIFLGQSSISFLENDTFNTSFSDSHIYKRVHTWLDVTHHVLNSNAKQCSGKDYAQRLLFATAVYTTVFWDVPSCRTAVVNDLVNKLAGNSYRSGTSTIPVPSRLMYCFIGNFLTRTISYHLGSDGGANTQDEFHIHNSRDLLENCWHPIVHLLKNSARDPLPPSLSVKLVNTLSTLTIARQTIMTMARGLCQFLFQIDSSSYTDTACNDDEKMDLALEGLLSLIRKHKWGDAFSTCSEEALDAPGMEALFTLTSMIHDHRPILSPKIRSTIFIKVHMMIEEGALHSWTQQRLISSAIVIFLSCFCPLAEDGRCSETSLIPKGFRGFEFVPENYMATSSTASGSIYLGDDLPALTCLILSYVHCNEDKERTQDNIEFSLRTIKEGENPFLSDLIAPKKGVPVESRSQEQHQCHYSSDLKRIAFACIKAVLNYIEKDVDKLSHDKHRCRASHTIDDTRSPLYLQKAICEKEEEKWKASTKTNKSTSSRNACKFSLYWTRTFVATNSSTECRPESVPSHQAIKQTLSSLCSIMSNFFLEFLDISDTLYTEERNAKQIRNLLYLAQGINALLNFKRRFTGQKRIANIGLSEGSLVSTLTCKKDVFSILKFFEYSRELLVIFSDGDCFPNYMNIDDFTRLMVSAIGDQCQHVQLILETNAAIVKTNVLRLVLHSLWKLYSTIYRQIDVKSSRQDSDEEDTTLTMLLFSSDQLMLSMISCFQSVLFAVIKNPYGKEKIASEEKTSSMMPFSDLSFSLQVLQSLSDDICAGLQLVGPKGRKAIFDKIVVIIFQTAKICLHACQALGGNILNHGNVKQLKDCCQGASRSLWDTLTTVTMKNRQMFQLSLQCSIWYFPKIFRLIDHLIYFSKSSSSTSKSTSHLISDQQGIIDDRNLLATTLCQCSEAYKTQFLSTKKSCSVGELKSSSIDNEKRSQDSLTVYDSSLSQNWVPASLHIQNKQLNDWAFSCSTMMGERLWTETRDIIIKRRVIISEVDFFRECHHALTMYTVQRRLELGSILNSLNSLFDNNQVPTFLTKGGKHGLCSCLEIISITLKCSLRFLLRWLRRSCLSSDAPNTKPSREVVVEAAACLLAWVYPSVTGSSAIDFTIGTRRWQNFEKINGKKSKTILPQIDKLLEEIEEMESLFQNFCLLLEENKSQDDSNSTWYHFDDLARHVIVKDMNHAEENNSIGSICSKHLKHLKDMAERVEFENERASREENRPNNSRQSKHRSNNGVVDEWLELDSQWKEGDDVFNDLEDFLVEG